MSMSWKIFDGTSEGPGDQDAEHARTVFASSRLLKEQWPGRDW